MDSHNLAISPETFRRECLRDKDLEVGAYDSRYTMEKTLEWKDPVADDPAMGQYTPIYVGAMNDAMHTFLGMEKERATPYRGIDFTINGRWDYKTGEKPEQCLVAAMRRNKNMRALFMTGLYDLVTPPGNVRYLVSHQNLPKDRVIVREYTSGHMPYMGKDTAKKVSEDLRNFLCGPYSVWERNAMKKKLDYEDLRKMKYLSSPSVDAKASAAAYVVAEAEESGEFKKQIYWIATALEEGKRKHTARLLINEEADLPTFSPDGEKLAYLRLGESEFQIWIYDRNTKQHQKLTQMRHGVEQFSWSPDGKKVAFTAPCYREEKEVWMKEMTVSEKKQWEEEKAHAPVVIENLIYKLDDTYGVREIVFVRLVWRMWIRESVRF